MGMYDKENIEDYRRLLDSSKRHEKIVKDPNPFKSVDGSFHATMEEIEAFNEAYWQYKNPLIIDKDSELFSAPLSQGDLDRIVSSATYRGLIDVLEERFSQSLSNNESSSMKR